MSVKSTSSIPGYDSVVRAGYLKKLKTYKKKFFVLHAEASESSARLEYYDSEKKFNNGQAPKRSIPLKTCFNINKRVDTKHKHVIALYTKVDCFCIVLESEEELDAWLKALLSLQHGEEAVDGETPRPTFEHVWQVTILNRGLGGTSVIGAYNKGHESATFRLCLTDKTLTLIRKDRDAPHAELSLTSIRSCGSLKNYVYLEIGRSSVTGCGELWMETEDSNIAQNVHETILHAMSTSTSSSSSKEELAPKSRYRSSSATEASKPAARKPAHGGATAKHHAQDTNPQIIEPQVPASTSSTHIAGSAGGARERCDSMPSRARTSSEGTHPIHTWIQSRSYLTAHRPQSLYVRDISHSPPVESPLSPPSAACSTDSAGSSLSIDDPDQWCEADTILSRYSHSLTPDEAIAEENYEECPDSPCLLQGTSPSGYTTRAPISSDDGYVDMSPRGRHTTMSPAASISSVTSGTPSTDMRFIEYPLEKVSAYFTPSEDETSLNERPIRAYSVGSRPDIILNKAKVDMASTLENARVRAFSVGSKSRKILTRVLPPHGNLVYPKPKASSAPLLNSSRALLNHNADLMEMDFTRPSPSNSGYMDMAPENTGYMEMRPGLPMSAISIITHPDYLPMQHGIPAPRSLSAKPPQQEPISAKPPQQDYVIAKPPQQEQIITRPPQQESIIANPPQEDYPDIYLYRPSKVYGTSPKYPSIDSAMEASTDYMDMGSTYQSPKPSTREGYVEMSLGRHNHHRQSSLENDDYTNKALSAKKTNRKDSRSQPIAIQSNSSTSANTQQFSKGSSSISPVYSSLHIGRKYSAGAYMPITTNTNTFSSLPRQRSRKNSRRDSKDSSSSSVTTPSSSSVQFPLSLNSPSSPLKPVSKTPESQSTGTIKIPQAIINVKYNRNSDYTPMDINKPHDYVNYCPSSMLNTTDVNDDSDYTFMRSRPESIRAKQQPVKAKKELPKAKRELPKAKTELPKVKQESPKAKQEPNAKQEPIIVKQEASMVKREPLSAKQDPTNVIQEPTKAKQEPTKAKQEPIKPHTGDYAVMKPASDSGDYALMRPVSDAGEYAVMRRSLDSGDYAVMRPCLSGDYAIMRPISLDVTRHIEPVSSPSLTNQLSSMVLSRTRGDVSGARSFIPISDGRNFNMSPRPGDLAPSKSQEDSAYECMSPVAKISRPNSVNSEKRPNSTSSDLGSSSSTLVGSRPASVNSESIRPASVNIEGQLHYASLDLAPTTEEDCNRSPRTSKPDANNTSPTQTAPEGTSGFTYAEIDFIKSEGLKHGSSNAKVKN